MQFSEIRAQFRALSQFTRHTLLGTLGLGLGLGLMESDISHHHGMASCIAFGLLYALAAWCLLASMVYGGLRYRGLTYDGTAASAFSGLLVGSLVMGAASAVFYFICVVGPSWFTNNVLHLAGGAALSAVLWLRIGLFVFLLVIGAGLNVRKQSRQ